MREKTEGDGTVAVPVTPSDINVRVEGGGGRVVVAKHTPLPYSTELELELEEEEEVILIEEGERCLARAKIPKSDDNSKVSLHLQVLEDCGIEAILKDCSSNERTSIHIPAPTGA